MAKISLNKITQIKKIDPVIININGQEVTIVQYLPADQKAKLIEVILNNVMDDTGFLNSMRLDIYTALAIVQSYTNISITDKMWETPTKLYDILQLNNVIDLVISNIPHEEYDRLIKSIHEAADHAVAYINSFAGILKTITTDYKNTEMNVEGLLQDLNDPSKIELVKDILTKIG